ncbi:NAD(P)H-dependent oxidoreductase [Patescibacteria group bacterium]|nr:NAD(P)H-dependent oxidoreductase [Patescibacteria group bacterium]
MHSLIITAHPSKKGFTHRIANHYKKAVQENGNTAKILNLYDDQWHQEFLNFESILEIESDDVRDEIQRQISKADELIFVFPIWWGDAPAIMKNFFDTNFLTTFAFKYDGSGKEIGLLEGKKARMFMTCDNYGFLYKHFIIRLPWLWGMGRLGFCGIKLISMDILSQKRTRSSAELDRFLKLVEKRAIDKKRYIF